MKPDTTLRCQAIMGHEDAEIARLQRRVEALESLYDAALSFCHSIEATLKHGRASSKAIALEQAVQKIAALRGGGTG